MSPLVSDSPPLPSARGVGDFQHKEDYARAEIEIREGRVCSVEFTDDAGAQIAQSGALRRLLEGHTVSRALSVTIDVVGESGTTEIPANLCMVLIEAFHRAVESCFDAE